MGPYRLCRILLGVFAVACVGCGSVYQTEKYYHPAPGVAYAPKPQGTEIPILHEFPKKPHEVIGTFGFDSSEGVGFVYAALAHNARKAGADAVVITKVEGKTTTRLEINPGFTYYRPAVTTSTVQTTYDRAGDFETRTSRATSTANVPIHVPGSVEPRSVTIDRTEAVMIKNGLPSRR